MAAETAAQATVTVKEAARIAGVGEKQVRAWVKDGTVRADLVRTRYGPTYAIEASSLPPPAEDGGKALPLSREARQAGRLALETGAARVETRLLEALMAMLSETQARAEGAMTRAAQLEGERERRLALESHAEHLQQEAARAAVLEIELRQAREQRALLLVAVLALLAAGVGLLVWRLGG